MSSTCYLLGLMDRTGRIVAVDTFSERWPTLSLALYPVSIYECYAATYAVALAEMESMRESLFASHPLVGELWPKPKQSHAFGHALCQACEEGRPGSDPGHDCDECALVNPWPNSTR